MFLIAAAVLAGLGVVGRALAEWGLFSTSLPVAAAGAVAVSALAGARRSWPVRRVPSAEDLLLVALLAAALVLAVPPHELILGDDGAPVSVAAALARSGAVSAPLSAAGGPSIHDVLLALACRLAGAGGVLWTGPVFAVLALAGAAVLARRLFDGATAVWAAVFLVVNPARIWFSRCPVGENLSAVWVMAALLAFAAALETRSRLLLILAALYVGAVFLDGAPPLALPAALALGLFHWWGKRRPPAGPERPIPPLRGAAALGVILLATHAYYAVPRLDPRMNGFVSIGWYVDPLGLLLATLGLASALVRQRSSGAIVLLALALVETIVTNRAPVALPQFAAARGYLMVVFPCLAIFAAHMIVSLGKAIRSDTLESAAPPLFGLALALTCLSGWLPLRFHVEHRGALAQVARLASHLPEGAVVLFDDTTAGRALATPIEGLWRRSAVILPAAGEDARVVRWLAEGRPAYAVRDSARPAPAGEGYRARAVGAPVIDVPTLAPAVGRRPDRIERLHLDLTVYRLQAGD